MTRLESVNLAWEGALVDIAAMPEIAVVGLVLTFLHSAGTVADKHLESVLRPLLGRPRPLYVGLRRYLTWDKARWPVVARATRRKVVVKADGRLRAGQMRELVEHLAKVPGASDLRIRGKVAPAA
jgi:hypothetical protein